MDATKAASVLGKLGRSVNSEAQAEASRINGRLGGRPARPGSKRRKRKAVGTVNERAK